MGAWVSTKSTRGIVIKVDDSSDDEVMILEGKYGWQFPVFVPASIPFNNVFYIAVCSDRSCEVGTCEHGPPCHRPPRQASVLAAFPVPGFRLGQLSREKKFAQSSAF